MANTWQASCLSFISFITKSTTFSSQHPLHFRWWASHTSIRPTHEHFGQRAHSSPQLKTKSSLHPKLRQTPKGKPGCTRVRTLHAQHCSHLKGRTPNGKSNFVTHLMHPSRTTLTLIPPNSEVRRSKRPTLVKLTFPPKPIPCIIHHIVEVCPPRGSLTDADSSHRVASLVTEGIVLGHLISSRCIEVDKSKIDIIISLPNPTSVWEVRSFLGHAGFYRSFLGAKDPTYIRTDSPSTKLGVSI
ncbi:hypothetical protein CR513_41296, partial [Mucuna pruriens]